MQQFDDFTKAVEKVGTAVADLKDKAQALHAAIDAKVDAIGKQAASDTALAQK